MALERPSFQMLQTALDIRLEMLAKRVSRVEERCQVQAEVFLMKSSSADELSAKLHEVSEGLQQKADSTELESISKQMHVLRASFAEAVSQVHALNAQLNTQLAMQAERSRPWSFCGSRARPRAAQAGQADTMVQWLEKTKAAGWPAYWALTQQPSEWPLPNASLPNMGAGVQPGSCSTLSPVSGGIGQELLLQGGPDRPSDVQEPAKPRAGDGDLGSQAEAAGGLAKEAVTAEGKEERALLAEARPPPRQASGNLPEADRLNNRNLEVQPEEILRAVLSVERFCREQCEGSTPDADTGNLAVELLVDEPTVRYCMCSNLDSPTVISVLSAAFEDIFIEDAIRALTCKEELDLWNSAGEFKVLQEAREEDPRHEHIVHYTLKAPWPFWDRDVLQRRWRLQLPSENGCGEGCAVVMRSVSGDQPGAMREQEGVIRAFVYGAAFLLRPLHEGSAKGTQLTYLTQIDIGGLCPAWAQGLLMRMASRGVVEWSVNLGAHCTSIRKRRLPS